MKYFLLTIPRENIPGNPPYRYFYVEEKELSRMIEIPEKIRDHSGKLRLNEILEGHIFNYLIADNTAIIRKVMNSAFNAPGRIKSETAQFKYRMQHVYEG